MKLNSYVTQSSPPWGIARISHQDLDTSTYVYDSSGGEGVCAYVIDTGILTTHNVWTALRRRILLDKAG